MPDSLLGPRFIPSRQPSRFTLHVGAGLINLESREQIGSFLAPDTTGLCPITWGSGKRTPPCSLVAPLQPDPKIEAPVGGCHFWKKSGTLSNPHVVSQSTLITTQGGAATTFTLRSPLVAA